MTAFETLYAQLPPAQQQAVRDFAAFLFEKYKKERLEYMLSGLGFKNPHQFFYWRMFGQDKRYQTDNQVPFEEIEAELAKQNTDYVTYLEKELRAFLTEEIANFTKEIHAYEQKYKMTWEEVGTQMQHFNQFGIIEREDDYMNWVTALDFVEGYQETLNDLGYGGTQ